MGLQGTSRFNRRAVKVSEAQQRVLAAIQPLHTEKAALWQSGGRRLAEKLVATSDWPPFARSGLDGFAIRGADAAQASPEQPVTLRVVDAIAAGQVARERVGPGTAVRIMTGAAVPDGADAVVMLEQTADAELDGQPAVRVKHAAVPGQNVAPPGEEFRRGSALAEPGAVIRPGHIAMLGSFGYAELPVYARPRVAVFATGTELLPVDAPLEPGKIRDSNSAMVAAMVVQYGGEPVVMGTLPDRVDAVVEALTAALAVADCIVTTGGVSVGDYDVMAAILSRLKQQGRNSRQACQNREGAEGTMPVGGERAESTMPADVEGAKPHDCDAVERFSCDGTLLPEPESAVSPDGEDDSNRSIEAELHSLFQDDSRVLFDKVAMRPGSPTSAMLLGGKPLFALSGNPGACFVGFELFVRPALSRMQGDPEPLPRAVEAELTESIIKGSPHERYVRAKLLMREGRVLAEPLGFGKSSMMASIPEAEALLVVPPGSKGVSSGERVKLIPIQR